MRILFTLLLLVGASACASAQKTYTLTVYNAENVFDADGQAVYDDYQPRFHTPEHVYHKVTNIARLMRQYEGGAGPHVIVFNEIEADRTAPNAGGRYDLTAFRTRWSGVTLEEMLLRAFTPEVADLPSELFILKAFEEAGLTGYDVVSGYAPLEGGVPTHAIKNVVFSRLPIDHARTRSHPTQDARPILEVWVEVDGRDLAVFANHWKSGAGNPRDETTRLQNAEVLKARLDALRAANPAVDFVLAGDFNSDYNQKTRYGARMPRTAVNDVLGSTGDEARVAAGGTDAVYNLWYEWPIDDRGSDQYRGEWGTLMQIMVSPGMYERSGTHYVDGSFSVDRFDFNTYATSRTPVRWSSALGGYGFSDHLPISMRFTTGGTGKVRLERPSVTDDSLWQPIAVATRLPQPGEYTDLAGFVGELRTREHFDRLFRVEAVLTPEFEVVVAGQTYQLYAAPFRVQDELAADVGKPITFFGRLGQFRGRWQFVIEDQGWISR